MPDRIHYVHDQHLPTLLRAARGTVVINSTVGLSSLFHGTPVKTMGRAIYDLPRLTFAGSLDTFWQGPPQPCRETARHFRQYLIRTTQVNGSFYSGRCIAVPEQDVSVGIEEMNRAYTVGEAKAALVAGPAAADRERSGAMIPDAKMQCVRPGDVAEVLATE